MSDSKPLIKGGSTRAACSNGIQLYFEYLKVQTLNSLRKLFLWRFSNQYFYLEERTIFLWKRFQTYILVLEINIITSNLQICEKRFRVLTPRRKTYIRAKKRSLLHNNYYQCHHLLSLSIVDDPFKKNKKTTKKTTHQKKN